MEGVEDIPETVLSEGINFTWETFPEYLNALDLSNENRLIRNSLITIYELNSNFVKSDSLFTLLISQSENDALTLNNYEFIVCMQISK